MNNLFGKILFILSVSTVISFSSCEKTVLDDDEFALEQPKSSSRLTITTRSGDDSDEGYLVQTQIYIFSQAGECVQILTTDGDNTTETIQIAPGTYTLYAVGGGDLDRFMLPEQFEAMPTSIITLKEGKVVDNFYSKQVSITMRDGESLNENIKLERKVICLNKVEIKDVPANVTAVRVGLSPLYNSIRLDGTFPSSPLTSYKISLTKQSDGTTWKATPGQLLFPSKDEPTLTISFTIGNGVDTYSYTMSEVLEANHYYNLSGAYKSSKASLTVKVTATNWDEERDVDFEFNDNDITSLGVGQFYNGYYIVSVNEQAQTAVLLSEHIPYNAPSDLTEASLWRSEIEARMAALEKPANITNNWRLPTVKEVEIFTKDPNAVTFTEDGYSPVCFCEDDKGNLVWAYTKKDNENGTYTFVPSGSNTTYKNNLRLRPVIDITY